MITSNHTGCIKVAVISILPIVFKFGLLKLLVRFKLVLGISCGAQLF